jgi:hypothetical protein
MADDKTFRDCPFCKEQIKSAAVVCKHCKSSVEPEHPDHDGTCPFCREEIKLDARKCKHCGSWLIERHHCDCGCSSGEIRQLAAPRAPTGQASFGQGCFYDCLDRHIGHGDQYGPGLHRHCENRCRISMPPQGAGVALPVGAVFRSASGGGVGGGIGQNCFDRCIDEHIAHGDTYGPGLHRHCENRCSISMPMPGSAPYSPGFRGIRWYGY